MVWKYLILIKFSYLQKNPHWIVRSLNRPLTWYSLNVTASKCNFLLPLPIPANFHFPLHIEYVAEPDQNPLYCTLCLQQKKGEAKTPSQKHPQMTMMLQGWGEFGCLFGMNIWGRGPEINYAYHVWDMHERVGIGLWKNDDIIREYFLLFCKTNLCLCLKMSWGRFLESVCKITPF